MDLGTLQAHLAFDNAPMDIRDRHTLQSVLRLRRVATRLVCRGHGSGTQTPPTPLTQRAPLCTSATLTNPAQSNSHPSGRSHFVLAAISIPIERWAEADREISEALAPYDLSDTELHTAFMLRPYRDQARVADFAHLDRPERRARVLQHRQAHLTAWAAHGVSGSAKPGSSTSGRCHTSISPLQNADAPYATLPASWPRGPTLACSPSASTTTFRP